MNQQADQPHILGRLDNLEVRLAVTASEIDAAQKLRYDVFYREMGATADPQTAAAERDQDGFDAHCEHLLVIDRTIADNHGIVGTYRFLDGGNGAQTQFYSAREFNLDNVVGDEKRCLELGRSCIAKSHRSRRTMELAWHGIWSLVVKRKIDVMFGCASFHGTDPQMHADAFAFLSREAALDATEDALPVGKAIALDAFDSPNETAARTLAGLPPLLKGYLRLGAGVSSHAVIDEQFGTMDVLVVLNVSRISQKYIDHYGAKAERFAA